MCVCVCLFVMVFYSPRGLHLKEMQLCQVSSRSDTAQRPNEMITSTCTSDQEPCSTGNCIGVQLVWRSASFFPLQCKWNHTQKIWHILNCYKACLCLYRNILSTGESKEHRGQMHTVIIRDSALSSRWFVRRRLRALQDGHFMQSRP